MDKIEKDNISEKLLKSLINGVKPALGCTEPVAVGLATAKAYEAVEGEIINIKVDVSANIFKNGMGVGIPGTKEIGLVFATALAVACGDSSLGLEVFKNVDDKTIAEAQDLIDRGLVEVNLETEKENFYIKAEVTTVNGKGICIIKDGHTNIVYVEANGKVLFEKESEDKKTSFSNEYLKDITLGDIRSFVEGVSFENIKFLLEGVKLNMAMADVGLKDKPGPGLGAAMNLLMEEGVMQKDVVNKARAYTSAAADARMAGVNMPVMSSAGSGNHGITAIIPTTMMCEHLGYDNEKLARALAFSHLTTAYIKTFTGALSPVCGCAVAAGIGASTSIAWLLGGTNEQIAGAIKNMVGTLAGLVCDGAKSSCAFKLSTAASEAIIQAKLAVNDVVVGDFDGLVSPSGEDTIKNLGRFCGDGMEPADRVILDIMTNK